MAGRWIRGLLHLLVGGACGALVAWLGYGFTVTIVSTDGPAQVAVAALVAVSAAVVVTLLLAPPVRAAEVALARALLATDLPEPLDTTSLEARGRGLLWAGVVLLLGSVSLGTILWAVPQGVVLVVAAFAPVTRETAVPFQIADAHPVVLVGLGVALLAGGIALQPLLVRLLERLAPRVLGPTPADRLAHADAERTRLRAANALARELHDSIGHSLTAIGVQAEAGARVAARDPELARESLGRITGLAQRAVAELDDVLGMLRQGDEAGRTATQPERNGLPDVLALLGDLAPGGTEGVEVGVRPGEVDDETAAVAYRVVQEALTNAQRHGVDGPTGSVSVTDGLLQIVIANRMRVEDHPGQGRPEQSRRSRGRRSPGRHGLLGMRERVEALGGSLVVGLAPPSGGEPIWQVRATLPARVEEEP
ncbi:sensor histidine kinase [Georgenia sp. Z1344]|uniref:sensor histidine kinase n=1 Tax=Georgenia sp. Z1344 TaxID=3416706 RepID=UPI003CE9ACB4